MNLFLFLFLIIALVFGKWFGIPCSWILKKIVANPYGAIVVLFLLILSFIRLFNIFTGETRIQGLSFPRLRSRTYKTKTVKEK